MLGALERFVALEDVGRLAQGQPKIGPLERDVAEADRRTPGGLLRGEPRRVGLNPGQRHARLHAPLDFDERDLHVDGGCQVGLGALQLPELDDLAGFGARRARRSFRTRRGLYNSRAALVPARARPTRSVLIIGSEALPFAKTGGLADVLGALPPALARLGWDATVALPRYRGVEAGRRVGGFPLTVGGQRHDVALYEAPLDGARAILVDVPAFFDRDELYGAGNADYPDNPRRFAFLARAALEYAAQRARGLFGRSTRTTGRRGSRPSI